VGAAVASLLGVWVLSLITRTTRIKQDAAMGIVLAGWFAIGIAILAFIQQRPDASQAGLDTFIFGQAAAIVERDVRLLAFITAATVLIVMLNWKELKLVTFDPDFAKANGFRVSTFTVLLLATIVVAVVVGLQLAGVVLMVGLLIAPGIAARQWTNTLEQMVVLAAIVGATAGVLGAIVSAVDVNVPTGPMIIIAAFLFVLVSLLFAPGRGVIWSAIRRRSDRRRYAAVNVRKTTLRYADGHEEGKQAVSEDFLVGVIGKSARTGINKLVNTGELLHGEDGYELSGKGRRNAQKDEDLRRGERYGGD
jgi:manganese/zinc/iron transport system permease protein